MASDQHVSEARATSDQAPRRPKPAPALHKRSTGRVHMALDLGWLIVSAGRATPWPFTLLMAIALIQGLMTPVQLWLTKALVDALAAQFHGAPLQHTALWLGLLVVSLLLDRTLGGVQPWLHAILHEQTVSTLQESVMRTATRLDLSAFEHEAYYDELNRVMSDVDSRIPQLLQYTQQLLRTTPQFIGYTVALATLTPILLAIVIVPWLLTVYGWMQSGLLNWNLTSSQMRDLRLSQYYASILTDRRFAKEVRLYGLPAYVLKRWADLFWKTRIAQRRLTLRNNLKLRSANIVSTAVIMGGLVWVVTSNLVQTTAGGYALLFQSIMGLTSTIFGLGAALEALGENLGYASAFRAFTHPSEKEQEAVIDRLATTHEPPKRSSTNENPPERRSGAPALRLEQTHSVIRVTAHEHTLPDEPPEGCTPFPRPLTQGIRFQDVWFTYPGSDYPSVTGVSFEIAAGETVAIVGENGAGKTTLVKLLLGLYWPDDGSITFDGIDMRMINPCSLRTAMSAVLQQFVQYELTFGENVGLGQPERLDDTRRLELAVEQAGARDIVERLPQGYTTLLGPDVGGVDLSGGQWQRIAIARGFFREAEILVLDEPSAALDPLAELAVFERFAEMVRGRTAVLISHRLGMARLADRIFVMARGTLVEQGTHEELLQAGGEYATLFRAQARWYK